MIALKPLLSQRMTMSSSSVLLVLVSLWAINLAAVSVMAQSTTQQGGNVTASQSAGSASTTPAPMQSTTSADNYTGTTEAPTTLMPPEASTAPSGSMSVWASGNSMLVSGLVVLFNYLLFVKVAH